MVSSFCKEWVLLWFVLIWKNGLWYGYKFPTIQLGPWSVIIVASELFLRSLDVPRGSSQQNKLLLIQGLVLLAISGSLYLYNGVPFLLSFISLFIIWRVLFAKRPSVAFEYTYNNHKVVISKPLGTIPKNPVRKENSVPLYELQIDNTNGLNDTQKITYQHYVKKCTTGRADKASSGDG